MSNPQDKLDKWVAKTRSYVRDGYKALERIDRNLDVLEEWEPECPEEPDKPEPPEQPDGVRRAYGMYGLNGSNEAGEFRQKFYDLTVEPCSGWVYRVPWWAIEVEKNEFDWGLVEIALSRAKQKQDELGSDFNIIFYLEAQCYGSLQNAPYTAGPPGYIVDDPDKYGGASGGPGGMWPNKNDRRKWRTSRHHPAFIGRWTELYKRYIDRYGDEDTVVGAMINEPALGMKLDQTDFYQHGGGDGYLDRHFQMLTDLKDHGCPFTITHQSNFWNGARGNNDRKANRDLMAHMNALNTEIGQQVFCIGAPDSPGDGTSQGYTKVFQGWHDGIDQGTPAPIMSSLQYQQYTDSTGGKYSLESCHDLIVKDFGPYGLMQWVYTIEMEGNDWHDSIQIFRDNDGKDDDYTEFLNGSRL